MKKYTKPAMEVKEFRAKETVASLADWLNANGLSTELAKDVAGAVSYYVAS